MHGFPFLGKFLSRKLLKPVTDRAELPVNFPVNLSLNMAESPLKVECILPWLEKYPDRDAAQFLRNGLLNGFSLNADRGLAHVHFENLSSALHRPDIVFPLLAKEISAGRMSGPHPTPPISMRVSPLGIVKKSQDDSLAAMLEHAAPGMSLQGDSHVMALMEDELSSSQEYRLIFDLSAQDEWGQSVNSTTADKYRSVQYTSFDSVVEKVSMLPGCGRCSKSDVKSAFRLLKLSPENFPLTGMQYRGWFFLDLCMPFGSSTGPLSFETLGKFLNWVVIQVSGDPRLDHMLDDFFAFGPDDTVVNGQMSTFHSVAHEMGIPINYDKYVPSTYRICFLGLIIDMYLRMVIAPKIKIIRAWRAVKKLLSRRKHKVAIIQSAQGRLAYLCRAVPCGKPFLNRGYRLIAGKLPNEHVILTTAYILDLRSWEKFLLCYNGQTFFRDYIPDPDLGWFTDASTSWGAGCWIKKVAQYFVLKWPHSVRVSPESTTLLELCPIVVTLFQAQWEGLFRNKSLNVYCDSQAVCELVQKRSSGVPKIAKWLRCMVLRCMQLNCTVHAIWVPTAEMPSDPLSRNNIPLFLSQVGGQQQQIFPHLSGVPSLLTLARSQKERGQKSRSMHR